MDTTKVATLGDFVKVQQAVHIRSRNGADAHFLHEWNNRVKVFLELFCGEQKTEKDVKGPDPANWEDLPDSTAMGPGSLKFFEDLKSWLRQQSDQFAGV